MGELLVKRQLEENGSIKKKNRDYLGSRETKDSILQIKKKSTLVQNRRRQERSKLHQGLEMWADDHRKKSFKAEK